MIKAMTLSKASSTRSWLLNAGFVLLFVAIVLVAGQYSPLSQAIGAISIVVVIGHAVVALGWRDTTVFVAICLGVTFAIENIGVATGFPFGHYQFELHHIPRIGQIPIIVGPLYLGMGYLSWVVASLIYAGEVTRPRNMTDAIALSVISAFVMTQWDIVMDPGGSTLAGAWTWRDGGGFFGVPLSNFAGWLFITSVFYLAFAIYQLRRRAAPERPRRHALFWGAAIMLYLASGLCQIPAWLLDESRILIDPAGQAWNSTALRETAVIVMMMTMLPSSLIAALRLCRSR